MRNRNKILCIVVLIVCCLQRCRESAIPKPYGYFRIDLPQAQYTESNFENLFMYDKSVYGVITPSNEQSDNYDIWRNIDYPMWNARIHLSYKEITPEEFQEISEESRTLAYKHTIRADAIKEDFFSNPELNTYAIFYSMSGNSASQAQFFITDSVKHFLRGSLYFNNIPNADSIAPVSRFIEEDMRRMVETIEWNK